MLKFSANIGMMFNEIEDPVARIQAAQDAGFAAVELLFVYDIPVEDLVAETERTGILWSVVNIAVGEGIQMGPLVAAAPGKEAAFRENLAAAKKYCAALKPTGLVVPAYTPPDGVSKADALPVFKDNMRIAAEEMSDLGIPVIIEALNPEHRPNSLLTTTAEVMSVVEELNHPNLGIEYDAFHMYGTEGHMEETVEKYLSYIGNIQIADVPGRHEPGTGEVDYDSFLNTLDRIGYDKWVALEYMPAGGTLEGLTWLEKWR
ncbi:MAG: TIM barrel protein [Rhodospirillaceae bacterium]|jgi:hydroxypyruvate isomerase|nr:TIM barrel protein [Rhodospirillaceae bacterium]